MYILVHCLTISFSRCSLWLVFALKVLVAVEKGPEAMMFLAAPIISM